MWKNYFKIILPVKKSVSKTTVTINKKTSINEGYIVKPNPSPVYTRGSTGLGMSERAILPVAETYAHVIRLHIKAVIVKRLRTV